LVLEMVDGIPTPNPSQFQGQTPPAGTALSRGTRSRRCANILRVSCAPERTVRVLEGCQVNSMFAGLVLARHADCVEWRIPEWLPLSLGQARDPCGEIAVETIMELPVSAGRELTRVGTIGPAGERSDCTELVENTARLRLVHARTP
jgi:hypothetical protein